ncbi:MAG: hypothetical protein CVU52_00980 [Deltaproteobacteria bacterium HGW-Deltaproteobacteria-10]|nr:MAG: hypothetical protein CVU52_00980 [Deltaproteobacteria bacterium HGW-Deltaproteobacteria-10]
MAEHRDAENRRHLEGFVRFARENIACCEDIGSADNLPVDLWRQMGQEGLFGLGIAENYGGSGGNWRDLILAGEALVADGHNLGLALSWLVQQAQARFLISRYGDEDQRRRLLPAMARGNMTVSFAVSEPGHGAHPKHLTTKAQRNGSSFLLNGEKAYLTNGPIADLYIVIAVTSEGMGKKRFTAFLVPRETTGLSLTVSNPLPFLKPSPHGGIILADCSVPAKAILGEEGNAYETMVIPFGSYEELMMTGPILGALVRLEALTIEALRRHAAVGERALQRELGDVHAMIGMLKVLAWKAADDLEPAGAKVSLGVLIPWMHLTAAIPERMTEILTRLDIDPVQEHKRMQADLTALFALSRSRIMKRQEQIGAALLS